MNSCVIIVYACQGSSSTNNSNFSGLCISGSVRILQLFCTVCVLSCLINDHTVYRVIFARCKFHKLSNMIPLCTFFKNTKSVKFVPIGNFYLHDNHYYSFVFLLQKNILKPYCDHLVSLLNIKWISPDQNKTGVLTLTGLELPQSIVASIRPLPVIFSKCWFTSDQY